MRAVLDRDTTATLTIDDKTLKCEFGPVTILYHYEVTGTQDGALLLNPTAPKTKAAGTLTLEGNSLSIDIDGKVTLDFPWKRADSSGKPVAP